MPLPFKIRTRNGEYDAELDESTDMANAVWLSLPFRADINMLGSSIYFEMPIDPKIEDEKTNVFEVGDICWWPGVNALVILFGPMPLSGEDGKPVTSHKMIRIGRVIGDCSSMEDAGDRQRIDLVKDDYF